MNNRAYTTTADLQTSAGREEQVRAIIQESKGIDRGESRDIDCYKIYSGEINDDKFSFLTEYGENHLPAYLRWLPLVTPKINKLISQEAQRPVGTTIFASDQRSVEEKQERKTQRTFSLLKKKVSSFNEQLLFQQKRITQAKQRLNQLQSKQATGEERAEVAQLQENIPYIDLRLNQLLANLSVDQFITNKEMDEIDMYMTYEDKDIVVQGFQGALNEAVKKQHMPYKKVQAFRDKMITGKEFFFVDWYPGMPNPVFDHLPVKGVNWSNEENAVFIQDCRWVTIDRDITMNDVLREFGKEMKMEDLGDLFRYSNAQLHRNGYVAPTPKHGAVFINKNHYSSYKAIGGRNMTLTTVYWKQSRKAVYKESKNKQGRTFRHVVEEDYKPKKGEKINERHVDDLWVGHVINGKYFVGIEKHPVQLRNYEEPSKVQGPVIGYAFNNPLLRPYSVIWETRDLQETAMIMNYHRELLLAMSGVKGIVMDMSQRPDISDEDWWYDFKRGVAWIESSKQGKAASFNQFQAYDNTVSPAIGLISEIIIHLEETIGMVTGITRESMGNTKGTDQVGTYEMATRASNVVTYILFYEHDILLKEALTRYINLGRLAWKGGKQGTYMNDDQAQKIFKIHPDLPVDTRFDMILADSIKEDQKMEQLTQIAVQARNNREITLSQLISIIGSGNVKEVEKKVSYYSDKMAEIRNNQELSLEEKRKQVHLEGIKLGKEYDAMMENSRQELEKVNLMLEKAKVELDRSNIFINAQLKREEIASKERMSTHKVNTEAAVELSYLDEEKTMHRADEALRTAEHGLQGLNVIANMALGEDKVKVEKQKAKSQGMGKERIKDS